MLLSLTGAETELGAMRYAWHKTILSLATALLVLGPWLCAFSQEKQETEPEQFGGTYEQLTEQQKQLVDQWFQEYNKVSGQDLPPTTYNNRLLLPEWNSMRSQAGTSCQT